VSPYLSYFTSIIGTIQYSLGKKIEQIEEKIPERKNQILDGYKANTRYIAAVGNLVSADIALNGANPLTTRSIMVIAIATIFPDALKVVSRCSGYKLPEVFTYLDDSIIPVANTLTIVGSVVKIVRSGIALSPTVMIASSALSLYQSGVVGKVSNYVWSFFGSE